MILLKRLIPIITPIIIFAAMEMLFLWPSLIYFFIVGMILVLGLATWQIIGKGLVHTEARWFYLLTPISFLVSGIIFILFLEQAWVKHTLALALSFFLGVFLENIFSYIYRHEKYQANSLENISNYLNLTSVFFLNASLFGFALFLSLPLWELSLISLVISFILTFQTIWINKIRPAAAWLHIIVICLILFEVFWTLSFLPTAFYVNGLVMTAAFYFTNNLTRLNLTGRLSKTLLVRYCVLCAIILLVVLLTAKWS